MSRSDVYGYDLGRSDHLWKIYAMNECDWIVARSMEEAKKEYIDNYAGETIAADAHELTDEELDRLKYQDCNEDEHPTGDVLTFRESLARRAPYLTRPELFASTEF